MTALDWTRVAVVLVLASGLGALGVSVAERHEAPRPVPHETQTARLAAFERCVESASRSGPATFSPGDVVRACRDAAEALVAAEQMGPPERGGKP
jgi:hypothetical protein